LEGLYTFINNINFKIKIQIINCFPSHYRICYLKLNFIAMNYKHKIKASIIILCFCIHSAFAQTFKDVFNDATTVTYLGIDFTNVKVIGHMSSEVEDLVDRQFSAINELVLNEPKKYDLDKAFHKTGVPNDLKYVEAKNKTITESNVTSTDPSDESHLAKTAIDGIVKGYDFGGKKGIGFLFIMESMSKKSEHATMYLTFVDMATNKVLYTERVSEKAGGFGLRNYYAKPIYEALDDMAGSKYKEWKKAYGS
jgi:hypothetical protein